MQVFLDETGYSGLNLLDEEQPLFTIATVGLNEAVCKQLKQQHFAHAKLAEIKHANLGRRTRGQRMVLSFLEDILSRVNAFRFYVVHKRFALTRKFVDHFIEPAFYERGLNLYHKRQDINYAYDIFRHVPSLAGKCYFDKLLEHASNVLRHQDNDSIEAMTVHINSSGLHELVTLLLKPARVFLNSQEVRKQIFSLPKLSLDLSLTIALPLLSLWREDVGSDAPIELYHDMSSAMSKQSAWWAYITNHDRSNYRSDSGTVNFPIGIDKTEFVNSKDWAGIQLADVLAGAFNRACRWMFQDRPTEDEYGAELGGLLKLTEERSFLWMFPTPTPDHLQAEDGNESIEYLAKQLHAFESESRSYP